MLKRRRRRDTCKTCKYMDILKAGQPNQVFVCRYDTPFVHHYDSYHDKPPAVDVARQPYTNPDWFCHNWTADDSDTEDHTMTITEAAKHADESSQKE